MNPLLNIEYRELLNVLTARRILVINYIKSKRECPFGNFKKNMERMIQYSDPVTSHILKIVFIKNLVYAVNQTLSLQEYQFSQE